jgi:PAS domain S-box-containing protein
MPDEEKHRLIELRRYAILDSSPEPRFDRITALARRLFKVPVALISLVDEQRQWFKSHPGTDLEQTARDISFCTHAIRGEDVMVVPDATLDPRFAENPLVTGEPHIRFYAGAPLITPSGFHVGTLCLNDSVPRVPLTGEEKANLADLAGMVVDEMEFRLAERERREAERLFASVFETAEVGIAVIDEAGTVVHANPALCRMIHAPAAEIRGQSIFAFQPESEREKLRTAHEKFFATGAGMPTAVKLRSLDGRVLDIVLSSSLLAMEDGRRLRVSAATDVTEMRRTEEALRASNERLSQLAAIIESSDDAIIGRTLDGVITTWNRGAERLYGYTAAEMVGKSADLLVPADGPGEFPSLTEKLRRGESVAGHETTRVCKDGRRIQVSLTLSPIQDAQGNITAVSAIARDITDRKLLEEQLVQSQKMEAVALLAGGVAHDFNNLLTIIIGYGRLLLMEAEASTDIREYADEILYSAERASALTGQLLAFSRRQVVQPRVLDLNDAVESMHRLLERILGEHIELHTIPGESLGRIKADPGQIEQVIANLAVNARDAMPRGGKLTIETSDVELNEQYVRLHPQVHPGPYVMLAVSDTGSGMTPEVREHIFEPFFTTKEKGKGTGLGLSIIHGIVKQSGGEIWVYSEPGKGSTFKIYLPRIFEQADAWRRVRTGSPMPHGTETILVVEDEEPVKKMVRGILARLGYSVLEASEGQQALQICGSYADPIHLMVTDVVMPGMAGPDLARAVKILRPETRIIFMSGYTENSMLQHELIEPEANFLQKPFAPEEFAGRVREVLDGKG